MCTRPLNQWRPPVVSEHVKSILNPDTANVGTHEAVETFRLWANRAGILAGIGNDGDPPRRAGVSGLAQSQPREVEASPPMHGN